MYRGKTATFHLYSTKLTNNEASVPTRTVLSKEAGLTTKRIVMEKKKGGERSYSLGETRTNGRKRGNHRITPEETNEERYKKEGNVVSRKKSN